MTRRVDVSTCPNCGAPIDPDSITNPDNPSCPFCHAVLPLEPPPPVEVHETVYTPSPPTSRHARRARSSRVKWFLGGIVAVFLIGVYIFGSIVKPAGPPRYTLYGAAALVTAGHGSPDAYVIAGDNANCPAPFFGRHPLIERTPKSRKGCSPRARPAPTTSPG
jgi:hypothetical protein